MHRLIFFPFASCATITTCFHAGYAYLLIEISTLIIVQATRRSGRLLSLIPPKGLQGCVEGALKMDRRPDQTIPIKRIRLRYFSRFDRIVNTEYSRMTGKGCKPSVRIEKPAKKKGRPVQKAGLSCYCRAIF